ncbi:(2Fe-2S)-binding protein [Chelatococcus reniformis]|uniref:(2Fe-2S)-binding protein n=1 Tax=Chelatococcus reniformis TaxID=1494448 RepID=A0A916UTY6_9HYPH|nr:(2Fe-2S)-binding protein [Chelatococcus reniformis]GGC86842.1 (2Fe-2S)-binding protein [Chelatococcus reniformis]
MKLTCTVNGLRIEATAEPRLLLVDFLRHQLRLTATHVGCEIGVCGACTVIVDDEPVRSCLMLAVQADGCRIETAESLAAGGELSPMQASLHAHHGLQCGFCTPGILMTLEALARSGQLPGDEDGVRHVLGGHVCRCTGYQHIVDAVLAQAR